MADAPETTQAPNPPLATVKEIPTPKPDKTRWSGQLPTGLTEWLEETADARMCSEALLVTKGLELLQGSLPPLP